MLSICFLFLDFLCFAFCQGWIVYSTLCSLFAYVLVHNEFIKFRFGIVLGACLLQDWAVHGRFGLGLVLILPLLIFGYQFKRALMNGLGFLLTAMIILYFCGENIVFYRLILGLAPSTFVTIIKIFTNLIVGYVILWGMQGNRSLACVTRVRGRKVWTPNREDASQGMPKSIRK